VSSADPRTTAEFASASSCVRSARRWVLRNFAVALAQQPKVRRTLQKEIADYTVNIEAQAFTAE
jgi:hypothetical protein